MNKELMGKRVKDLTTGIKGVVSSCTMVVSGREQYVIEYTDTKGNPQKYYADEHKLKVLSKTSVLKFIEPEDTSHISFGDTVKNVFTGVKGVVFGRVVYINGCTNIGFEPKSKDEIKAESGFWYDYRLLKVIKSKRIELPVNAKTKTGGIADDFQKSIKQNTM